MIWKKFMYAGIKKTGDEKVSGFTLFDNFILQWIFF